MAKFIIGLTGGIGTGKTTVANLFAELGITLVDADVISRELVVKGSKGLEQIVAHFGIHILHDDGTLNRKKLRQRIFSNQQELHLLNALLHPMIRKELIAQVNNALSAYVVLVVPLLFENGLDSLVNRSLVIDIPEKLQLERTMSRDDADEKQINAIIQNQLSRQMRLSKADDILVNDGELSSLKNKVEALHQTYLSMAKVNKLL